MSFRSDNETGVCPEILAAIAEAATGVEPSYGADSYTARLNEAFSLFFDHEAFVWPVVTGTAANSIVLSTLTPPGGGVFCHRNAHITVAEAGAPEFYIGGGKLMLLDGQNGKITQEALEEALGGISRGNVHVVQPAALSLTQATETGQIYRADEIEALASAAHSHDLHVHMDGARFCNALAALNCHPSDISWRAGVDVLSFGATKNGAMAAEAAVFFDADLAAGFEERRKRGGHLLSKMRYVSAQLLAYLENDVWRRNAEHANRMAGRLAEGLSGIAGVRIELDVEINMIFAGIEPELAEKLRDSGTGLVPRAGNRVRLVTAFSTTEAEVDDFLDKVRAAEEQI